MKADIHPTYYPNATFTCACGAVFTIGSTKEKVNVEICSKCHPFYTGGQKFIDTQSSIKRFEDARQKAATFQATQKKKVEEKKKSDEAPKSLRDMLMGAK
jgi:large subunit ribosomal protein L31